MWLEAPLQSWGCRSKFGRRETLNFPTKSGVIGLLLCAMGKGGEQIELLRRLSGLSLSVAAFPRKTRSGEGEKLSALCDFHMVGSGYDDQDPWQNLMIPKKSDGSKPVGSGTKMTYRYYLQDMAFAAALELPEDKALSGELERSLQAPVWAICLGRKSCVPVERVYQGTYGSLEQAFKVAGVLAEEKGRICSFVVNDGFDDRCDDAMTLNDVPVRFGTVKEYAERRVSIFTKETYEEVFPESNQG